MSRRALIRAAFAATAAAALAPFTHVLAAPRTLQTPASQIYFPETGHNIGFKFRLFYERNGGLELFGLPLTEVFTDGATQVQYFERARFELRPELPDSVALSLLGTELTAGRTEPAFQWLSSDPGNGRQFFPECGHSIGGAFLEYWQRKNGLVIFGYPVSEELSETSPDGVERVVQYFQRARFELHPEAAFTPNAIQLGHVGRQALDARSELAGYTAPATPIALLGSSTTGFNGSSYERRVNVQRASALFDGQVVQPGEEFSFIGNRDFSEAAGFVEGYGIVNGKLDRVIGGGLCQVSTTMFRAVSNAGLEILRRIPHSYVVYFYENIPGFDATVFTPGVDFRWRNDMPTPVTIITTVDVGRGTVTFDIYGTADGRQVAYRGPDVRNKVNPGQAIWQYDPKLAPGVKSHLVHGRAGMDVTLMRSVTMPDGQLLRQDRFQTHYQPWTDFWTYGKGVTPPADVIIVQA
jgi:hypothetical protein